MENSGAAFITYPKFMSANVDLVDCLVLIALFAQIILITDIYPVAGIESEPQTITSVVRLLDIKEAKIIIVILVVVVHSQHKSSSKNKIKIRSEVQSILNIRLSTPRKSDVGQTTTRAASTSDVSISGFGQPRRSMSF